MAGSMRSVIRGVFALSLVVCQVISLVRLGHENNINGVLLFLLEFLLISSLILKMTHPAWDIIYESTLGAILGILTGAVDAFGKDRLLTGASADGDADDDVTDYPVESYFTGMALFTEHFQAVLVSGVLLPKIGLEGVKMYQMWEVNLRFHNVSDTYGLTVFIYSIPGLVIVLCILLYCVRPLVLVLPLAVLLYLSSFVLGWFLCYLALIFCNGWNTIFLLTTAALLWDLIWQSIWIYKAHAWPCLPVLFTSLPFHLLRRETVSIFPVKQSWCHVLHEMAPSCAWSHLISFLVTYAITGIITSKENWLTDFLLGCIVTFVIGVLISEEKEIGSWPSALGLFTLTILYSFSIRKIQNPFLVDDMVLTVCMYVAWRRKDKDFFIDRRNNVPLKTVSMRY